MTNHIWRNIHLTIALVAGLLILLAAVTGGILAFESAYNQSLPYKSHQFAEVNLRQTLSAVKAKYPEVLKLSIDKNHFVKVETADGEAFYIHPKTAEKIKGQYKRSEVFQFTKNLHRSLFIGKTGRVIMAVVALLLSWVALSGIFLIVRRQNGWRNFFRKVVKEDFFAYFHTVIGRWALIPIIIISLTGVYMGLETLKVISKFKAKEPYDLSALQESPQQDISTFAVFDIPLSEVVKVDYPAFDDPEEVYKVELTDGQLVVNQFTGEVISTQPSVLKWLSSTVKVLHIGKGTVVWASVLLLTCIAILFFLYSGFAITLRRKKANVRNPFKKDSCPYIILVGTEEGATLRFANALHRALLQQGKKSFLAEMNSFSTYAKMQHLVVLTSTYGDGNAPASAEDFEALWQANPIDKPFGYTVVGFGSLAYPSFCQYARDVQAMLSTSGQGREATPLQTIHNQSYEAFTTWVNAWAAVQGLTLHLEPLREDKKRELHVFEVIEKTPIDPNDTFLVRLQPEKALEFESGDLLSITPTSDPHERLYSIGKMSDSSLLLSVKRHEQGVVSNQLNALNAGDRVEAGLVNNTDFHFAKKAPELICIATGTGIAPFLGMLAENERKVPITLFWGGRTAAAFALYQPFIDEALKAEKLKALHTAFSREGAQQHIYAVVEREAAMVADALARGAVVYICGSVAMQKDVTETLDSLCREQLQKPLSDFQNNKQIRLDCY